MSEEIVDVAPVAPSEVAPIEQTEAPKDDERIAARFSALSRKEKELVLKERGIKDQMANIKDLEDRQSKAKEDPLDFITRSGLSLDDVLNAALGKKSEPTEVDKISEIREELEKLKKQREDEKTSQKQREEEAAISQFKNSIKEMVKSRANDFEIIQAKELFDEVFDVINEDFEKQSKEFSGDMSKIKIMDVMTAAEMVENYYADDIRSLLEKTTKFRANTPVIPEQEQKSFKGVQEERVNMAAPTLTNKLVSVSAPTAQEKRLLTTEESLKKAASLLKWN